MTYIFAGVILLFLCPSLWFAYRQGLKDGLAVREGAKTIEPIPTPIEYVQQKKEAKKIKHESDKVTEGWNNIMNFDGTPQAKGVGD